MTLLKRNPNAPHAWRDEMPVANRYTFGLAGEKFFRGIKEEGRIFGTYCSNCNRTYVPATLFCERCLDQIDEWVDVGTVGEVVTFTHLHVNYDGSSRREPETVAFIRLGDGGLIHRLANIDPADVFIGMKVKAVFKSKSEREGSILDIKHFKPASG